MINLIKDAYSEKPNATVVLLVAFGLAVGSILTTKFLEKDTTPAALPIQCKTADNVAVETETSGNTIRFIFPSNLEATSLPIVCGPG